MYWLATYQNQAKLMNFIKIGCCYGPGYATPVDAMINGPKETLLYVICVQPEGRQKPDYLATVDIDPDSSSCGQVRERLN